MIPSAARARNRHRVAADVKSTFYSSGKYVPSNVDGQGGPVLTSPCDGVGGGSPVCGGAAGEGLVDGHAGHELGEQPGGGQRGVVGGLVGGAAGVGDDGGPVAEVRRLPGRPFHRDIGGDATEQDGVDAAAAQQGVELAGREAAHPLVGDDQIAGFRRQLRHDLRHVAAFDQAVLLYDHGQQRRVGDQVEVTRLPGDPGVDDGG